MGSSYPRSLVHQLSCSRRCHYPNSQYRLDFHPRTKPKQCLCLAWSWRDFWCAPWVDWACHLAHPRTCCSTRESNCRFYWAWGRCMDDLLRSRISSPWCRVGRSLRVACMIHYAWACYFCNRHVLHCLLAQILKWKKLIINTINYLRQNFTYLAKIFQFLQPNRQSLLSFSSHTKSMCSQHCSLAALDEILSQDWFQLCSRQVHIWDVHREATMQK